MDLLCDELLLQIFGHIKKDFEPIKLTCKRFYHLICELNKNTKALDLSDARLQDEAIYNSMIYSKKIFNKMCLNSNNIESLDSYWKLRTICSLKGSTITELTWTSAKMTTTEVIAILNLFPNLKSLCCYSWKIKTEFHDDPSEMVNLPELKSLSMNRCNDATTAFFIENLSLNSLTKLEVDFYNPGFLTRHAGLSALSFEEDELKCEWITVPLTHLTMRLHRYCNNEQPVLNSILRQQPNLVSLDISCCGGIFDGNDEAFVALCNMNHLKILKINIDDLSSAAFKENFQKLHKLEELTIESDEHDYPPVVDIIEHLSKVKLDYLKQLWLYIEHIEIPVDRIENMGVNYPHLIELHLNCDYPLPLDIYLKNLKSLRLLEINYNYTQEFSRMCNNLEGTSFPNINHIKLKGFNFGSDANLNEPAFLKLAKALPNVTEMAVEVNIPLNTKFLKKCLEKLPKLKVLKDLTFVQQKENYEKFDADCVNNFLNISEKLEGFSLELKLKAIDMNVHEMKEVLTTKFRFNMKRCGMFVTIELKKILCD